MLEERVTAALVGAVAAVTLTFSAKEWWSFVQLRKRRKMFLELLSAEISRNVILLKQINDENVKAQKAGKFYFHFFDMVEDVFKSLLSQIEVLYATEPELVERTRRAYFEYDLINASAKLAFQNYDNKKLREQIISEGAWRIAKDEIVRSEQLAIDLHMAAERYGFFRIWIADLQEYSKCPDYSWDD